MAATAYSVSMISAAVLVQIYVFRQRKVNVAALRVLLKSTYVKTKDMYTNVPA